MEKPTKKEILHALEVLQCALDAKHPGSEEALVSIRPTDSPLCSDATDDEGGIVAVNNAEIAEYLD